MNSIGSFLRTARERKGLSLDAIADATRINRKILENLEAGTTQHFPETYIRAFIRAYADELGLDAQEILRRKDAEDANEEVGTSYRPEPRNTTATENETRRYIGTIKQGSNKQLKVLIIFCCMVIGGLTISLYLIRERHSATSVMESSFLDVTKEWDGKYGNRAQQSHQSPDANPQKAEKDSLVLVGIASDSVWLKLTIDSAFVHEYLIQPRQQLRWTAKNKFLLSLGNTAGISFKLNGQPLGALGTKGKPLLHYTLDRTTLGGRKQISSQPIDHEKR